MRYPHSKEESNELLRLALPYIGRHGSGCQPPSYALWYEYVDGSNEPLRRALDERIARGSPLSADETLALYGQYIAQGEIAAGNELHDALQRMLDSLARTATHAGNDAARYGRSLDDCGDRLRTTPDLHELRGLVAALAVETRRMLESNARLTEDLEGSRRELLELSSKLANLRGEALLDPLTGLLNRRGLSKAIDEAIAARESGLAGWSLLIIDIDHFKRVNDTHGHILGDKVLQAVARVLRSSIKGQDIAVRLGGEEFAVLLPDTAESGAVVLAERIRQSVARGRIRRVDQAEPLGDVTVSIGVACHDGSEPSEQWLARADKALYASKQNGRNRVTAAGSPEPAAR
jgi:diguanylate cyclase